MILRLGSLFCARSNPRASTLCIAVLAVAAGSCGGDGDAFPSSKLGVGEASAMAGVCGDGVLNEGEQCDDGNALGADGCSTLCTRENSGSDIASDTSGAQDTLDAGTGSLDATSGSPDAANSGNASDGAASARPDASAGAPDAASAAGDAASETPDAASDTPDAEAMQEPLCPEQPAGACDACSCTQCKTEVAACENLAGNASEGPAAGQAKSVLCAALVRCGRASGCRGLTCICDPANTATCLGGTTAPDGPCKDQVLAAAETTSMETFLTRATAPAMGYAVAAASAVSTCSANVCKDACTE